MLECRTELEDAVLARITAVRDPRPTASAEYVIELRSAATTALDCGYAVLAGGAKAVEVPPELLVQARLAARQGIPLHTVQRRYYAGHALINDFLLREARIARAEAEVLHRLSRDLTEFFDRIVDSVSDEHESETRRRELSDCNATEDRVRRLLAGELVDHGHIDYDFDAWHVAVISVGGNARKHLADIAAGIGLRVFALQIDREMAWGWFSRREEMKSVELDRRARPHIPQGAVLSIGEQGEGVPGWRLSHRQALAALPIAKQRPGKPTRYGPCALLTTVLQDDLLAQSLEQMYISPLKNGGGNKRLLQTLRAYLAADRQISSTAAALDVSRKTVSNRLREIEELIGKPITACAPDLGAALLLDGR